MAAGRVRREDGVELAYEFIPGSGPVVVFLPGFGSDMGGTKAMHLWQECDDVEHAMLRLDYSGHGGSGGKFEEGSIGIWTADAASVIEAVAGEEELLLVGSSMGGWIALNLAVRLGERVAGMLLVAPAPDFTESIKGALSAEQKAALERDGVFYPPSEYGAPLAITAKLLADGPEHLLLTGKIGITCPVTILHGMRDADVPWQQSLKLLEALESDRVELVFLKDGDHRLSRPEDLRLLADFLFRLLSEDGA